MSDGVTVRVPATTANLGPGFDCLGAALGTYLTIKISHSSESEVVGRGRRHPIPKNLTYRSIVAAYEAAGKPPPNVRIETVGSYPSARGMGASASAIVAGLVGADALGELGLGEQVLAELATRIEGHPDNVMPALLGGLVLSVGPRWLRMTPVKTISPMILVTSQRFKTGAARKAVPSTFSREDAVANAGATAALVAILGGLAGPEGLMAATEDRLHEPYRLPLMKPTESVRAQMREAGVPTALSGAGPSLVSLVATGSLEAVRKSTERLLPQGWSVLTPGWDLGGATVG
ncbi:MAG: homoserine kinase [Actinomycetota bacterium]